ncbi:hypothetical protein WH47_02097, partial [Habropoda laboriosa]
NVNAHTSVTVTTFSAKKGVSLLNHPPYSPDFAPADFFLFPRLKLKLKGKRFQSVLDIQQSVARQLNEIKAEQFSNPFLTIM